MRKEVCLLVAPRSQRAKKSIRPDTIGQASTAGAARGITGLSNRSVESAFTTDGSHNEHGDSEVPHDTALPAVDAEHARMDAAHG